jgi:chromosomal replication initiation ATPase DnaA
MSAQAIAQIQADLYTIQQRLERIEHRLPPITVAISIDHIKATIAGAFGLTVAEMLGKTRIEKILWPRHLAIYISYKITERGPTFLSHHFSDCDAQTIRNAIESVIARSLTSDDHRRQVNYWLQYFQPDPQTDPNHTSSH